MRNKKALCALRCLPALLWMSLIFGFSMQNGQQSGSLSHWAMLQYLRLWQALGGAPEVLPQGVLEHIIRKAAHATEYLILAVLVFYAVQAFARSHPVSHARIWLLGLLAWGISTAYAATDELHQIFVSGRGPQVKDVCIDSLGAAAGITFAVLILVHRQKKRLTSAAQIDIRG